MISSVVILGSGNLATHFAKACCKMGISIKQIFGRNVETGETLARLCQSNFINDISQLETNADAYFFIMNDSANLEIINLLPQNENSIYVHTAGSQNINIFEKKFKKYGAFYPFLSFSKDVDLNFSDVPICIHASDEKTKNILHKLANELSCKSYDLNDEQRKVLHLSGVFAHNFMNHCVCLGEKFINDAGIDHEIIKPLLIQGFDKILRNGAFKSQTGPALRNDKMTMDKHLQHIKDDETLIRIYESLSKSINKTYNI